LTELLLASQEGLSDAALWEQRQMNLL